jgi:hypothetical protein
MKAVFKYLLIVFVFVNYFQSALEINNDYISNTFNDDHDIYIHSKDFSSQTIVKAEHQSNIALLPPPIFDLQILNARFCFIPFTNKADKTFEKKLFLKNRSLLI